MNKNLKIRLLADSGMTLALLLLMSYQLVGEKAHEWIGMAMFLLVIGHHVLNRSGWETLQGENIRCTESCRL